MLPRWGSSAEIAAGLRLGAATQGQARLAEDGGKRTIAEKKGLDEA